MVTPGARRWSVNAHTRAVREEPHELPGDDSPSQRWTAPEARFWERSHAHLLGPLTPPGVSADHPSTRTRRRRSRPPAACPRVRASECWPPCIFRSTSDGPHLETRFSVSLPTIRTMSLGIAGVKPHFDSGQAPPIQTWNGSWKHRYPVRGSTGGRHRSGKRHSPSATSEATEMVAASRPRCAGSRQRHLARSYDDFGPCLVWLLVSGLLVALGPAAG